MYSAGRGPGSAGGLAGGLREMAGWGPVWGKVMKSFEGSTKNGGHR